MDQSQFCFFSSGKGCIYILEGTEPFCEKTVHINPRLWEDSQQWWGSALSVCLSACLFVSAPLFRPLFLSHYLHKSCSLRDHFKVLALTSKSTRLAGWSVFEGPQLWNGNETLIGLRGSLSCLWLTCVTYGGSFPHSSLTPLSLFRSLHLFLPHPSQSL